MDELPTRTGSITSYSRHSTCRTSNQSSWKTRMHRAHSEQRVWGNIRSYQPPRRSPTQCTTLPACVSATSRSRLSECSSVRDAAPRIWKMRIKIDPDGDVPRYVQLQSELEYFIVTGMLPPGSRLPSIRELARETELSPMTVMKAFN